MLSSQLSQQPGLLQQVHSRHQPQLSAESFSRRGKYFSGRENLTLASFYNNELLLVQRVFSTFFFFFFLIQGVNILKYDKKAELLKIAVFALPTLLLGVVSGSSEKLV